MNIDAVDQRPAHAGKILFHLRLRTPRLSRVGQIIHTDIPALPFCHIVLKAQNCLQRVSTRTSPWRALKAWMDLGLFRRTWQNLGVSADTVTYWETGRFRPRKRAAEAVRRFLGLANDD
jgi:hypothetical protein